MHPNIADNNCMVDICYVVVKNQSANAQGDVFGEYYLGAEIGVRCIWTDCDGFGGYCE